MDQAEFVAPVAAAGTKIDHYPSVGIGQFHPDPMSGGQAPLHRALEHGHGHGHGQQLAAVGCGITARHRFEQPAEQDLAVGQYPVMQQFKGWCISPSLSSGMKCWIGVPSIS